MSQLTLLNEIRRDVEAANSRRSNNVTWKNWVADDIFSAYNVSCKTVKSIIERAIKTDGQSLDSDIKQIEQNQ